MVWRVIKPFAHSADGINAVDLNVGDEREHFDGNENGLVAEGFIEKMSSKADVEETVKETEKQPETANEAPAPEVSADFSAPEVAADKAPRRHTRK